MRALSSQRRHRGRQRSSPAANSFTDPAFPGRASDVVDGSTVETTFTGIAAGWLTDPSGRHEKRYWSGSEWTEHVLDDGVPGTDPPRRDTGRDAVLIVLEPGPKGLTPLLAPPALVPRQGSRKAESRGRASNRCVCCHASHEGSSSEGTDLRRVGSDNHPWARECRDRRSRRHSLSCRIGRCALEHRRSEL